MNRRPTPLLTQTTPPISQRAPLVMFRSRSPLLQAVRLPFLQADSAVWSRSRERCHHFGATRRRRMDFPAPVVKKCTIDIEICSTFHRSRCLKSVMLMPAPGDTCRTLMLAKSILAINAGVLSDIQKTSFATITQRIWNTGDTSACTLLVLMPRLDFAEKTISLDI